MRLSKLAKFCLSSIFSLFLVFCLNINPAYADGNSVAPGTLILTPNGNVPIEELQSGDRVIGYDFSAHEKTFNTISTIEKISSLSYYLIQDKTKISGTNFIYINKNSARPKIVRVYELKYYDRLVQPNHSNPIAQEIRQIIQPSDMYKIILDNEEGNLYVNNFLVYGGEKIPYIFQENYVYLYCGIGTPYFRRCNHINAKSFPSLVLVMIIFVIGTFLPQYLINFYNFIRSHRK